MTEVFWLAPFVPGVSALVLFLFGGRLSRRWIAAQASLSVLAAFALSLLAFIGLLGPGHGSAPVVRELFSWIVSGSFSARAAFAFDPLAAIMGLVVTGVGFLIHLYSAGYMSEDRSPARFFGLLNLFTFFMLVLVLASNVVLMFVGWEGVGLCSYLLIGFWFEKPSAAAAGKKAFLVNRIGDAAFLIGLLLVIVTVGSAEFQDLAASVMGGGLPAGIATLAAVLFFIGATGKSAQVPLYVWLPDAMEGPTPVSALIHAATMVTAGVYMVCRMSALFAFSEAASLVVALTGAVTAVFAATMALTENDIKRVLAYSTISQIGYMFIGCGVGAYSAGMFHLFTHAFFKSLLFLAAGSVIHALAGEQDLRKMGGLRRYLPRTFPAFFVGGAAIAGVPFFSGFFSKDAILSRAFAQGQYVVWALGLATAVLTAFYIFRLVFMAFYGGNRMAAETKAHIHESPSIMTVPLAVLAFFAVAAGYIGLPAVLGDKADLFGRFLAPVFANVPEPTPGPGTEWILMLLSAAAALMGVTAAYVLYVKNPRIPHALISRFPALYTIVNRKYYVDEAYEVVFVRPLVRGGEVIFDHFDKRVVDGALNGAAAAAGAAGKGLGLLQTGLIKEYALAFLIGAVLFLGFLLM
jgi:NADH-quinone oxidoreductase subunit L